MRKINLETTLSSLGITDFDLILKEGFNPERVKNNPRLLTEEALLEILKTIA